MNWDDDTQVFARRGKKVIGPTTLLVLLASYRAGKVIASDEVAQSLDGPWCTLSSLLQQVTDSKTELQQSEDTPKEIETREESDPRVIFSRRKAIGLIAGAIVFVGFIIFGVILKQSYSTYAIRPADRVANDRSASDDAGADILEKTESDIADAAKDTLTDRIESPETVPEIHRDYRSLALLISSPYLKSSSLNVDFAPGELGRVLSSAVNSDHAPTREAALPLLVASKKIAEAVQAGNASMNESKQNINDVILGSLRGDFSQQYEHTYRTESGEQMTEIQSSDNTIDQLFFSMGSSLSARGQADALLNEAVGNFNLALTEAWRGIEARLSDIYTGRSSRLDTVKFFIDPPNPTNGTTGSMYLRHQEKLPLHDVTIVLEIVHFSAAPEVYCRQSLFVPIWEVDQIIELPKVLDRNCQTDEYRLGRPASARPSGIAPWLEGAGGIVSVEFGVWASEGSQATAVVRFPNALRDGAKWELASVERMLVRAEHLGRERDPSFRVTTLPDDWCSRALNRVDWLEPNPSPLRDAMEHARRDPAGFLEQTVVRQRSQLEQLSKPDCVYSVLIDSPVTAANGPSTDLEDKLALKFTSIQIDSGKVKAQLFSPRKLDQARTIKGGLQRDQFGQWILSFNIPGLAFSRTEQINNSASLLTTGGFLELVMYDRMWVGRFIPGNKQTSVPSPVQFDFRVFPNKFNQIRFFLDDSDELHRASRELAKMEPTAEEFAAISSQFPAGRKWSGTWKTVSDRDFNKEPQFRSFPQVFRAGLPSGQITLEIHSIDVNDGEFEAEIRVPQAEPSKSPKSRLPNRGTSPFGFGGTSAIKRQGRLSRDAKTRVWTFEVRSRGNQQIFSPTQLNPSTSEGGIVLSFYGDALRGRMEVPGAKGVLWVEVELLKK